MIRWICRVKVHDKTVPDGLLDKIGLKNMERVLQINRLLWYGHVYRGNV